MLTELWEQVGGTKKHFPSGPPRVSDIRYMERPSRRYFGFYRFTDRSIHIHPALNSPDVPLFAMEFLVYHELLHADMPDAWHNRDFRKRERRFEPTDDARQDAAERGFEPAPTPDGWRALADQFFDTFAKKFVMDAITPGKRM